MRIPARMTSINFPTLRRAKPLLGTLVEVSIRATDSGTARAASEAAFAAIADVHRLMSFHDPQSDIGRINQAAPGESVCVDPRTVEVLALATTLAQASGGAFDCAVGTTLVRLGMLPAPLGSRSAWTEDTGDAQTFAIDGNRVIKHRACLIDLGGVAKGYAVDRAIESVATHADAACIEEILINAGGDLRHCGEHPATIHLRDPQEPSRIVGTLDLRNTALASSATAGLDFFEPRCVSALLDGRSHEPLPLGRGVSVSAPTCVIADALTKIVLATRDAEHPLLAHHDARVVFSCL